MKYCENCGAQLEDVSMFCDECGTKQEELTAEESAVNTLSPKVSDNSVAKIQTSKKSKKPLVIFLLLLIALLLGGGIYYYFFHYEKAPEKIPEPKEEVIEEVIEVAPETLYSTIAWATDMPQINLLKEKTLVGYGPITINLAFANYNATTWSYGSKENVEYLLVEYVDSDVSYQVIINTTLGQVDEILLDDVVQDEDAKNALVDQLFNIEIPFIGKSGSYTSVGATLNITIEGDIVTSRILVDFYDEELNGTIISDTEVDVRMASGEVIRYTWLDENKVSVNPVDGFSNETVSMIRPVCEALNNIVYTFDSTAQSDDANFVATYLPNTGAYLNSNDGGLPNTYEIIVHSTTNTSFIFSVSEAFDSSGNSVYNTIISNGVAEFSEPEIIYAEYNGDGIQLIFDCSHADEFVITGYEPMTRLGNKYYNFAAQF